MSRHIIQAATAALLLPLLAASLAAQQWSVGALGGANSSNPGGKDATALKSRIGVAGGAQVVGTLGDNLALEVDALYSMKGAKQQQQGATADVKLAYLELPLLLRVGSNTGGTIRPFAMVGASAGFRLSCSVTERAMGQSGSADCSEVADFRSFDASLIAGVGVDADLGSGIATLAVRYGHGLTSILQDAEVRNRATTILAGWRLPLGRR